MSLLTSRLEKVCTHWRCLIEVNHSPFYSAYPAMLGAHVPSPLILDSAPGLLMGTTRCVSRDLPFI